MRVKVKTSATSKETQKVDNVGGSKSPTGPASPPIKSPSIFSAMEGFAAKSSQIADIKAAPKQPPPENSKPPVADIAEANIDDKTTEAAIEDIVISESNELLAVHDAAIEAETNSKKETKKKFSFKALLKNKWLYFGLGLLVIIIFALPYSRYFILGQFLDNQSQVTVLDSTTHTPISGATVLIQGSTATHTTNAAGQIAVDLPLGKHNYIIKKQYYKSGTGNVFVGLGKPKPKSIYLIATGRRVPIEVVDKLSGKPLSGAEISILNTNAKTNADGQAFIILPTSSSDYLATISESDYSTVTTRIIVSINVNANTIGLVPAGSVYFLTNSSGKLNVVKANLDGSDPQVVLAGSGSEKTNSTFLMASPDWKYLLLEAQRSGSQPELYVINTVNNQVNEFDSSADSFHLIGWSGDQFIYDETNNASPTSTAGREQLKSYNAQTAQLNVLDQNQVNGDTTNYAYQSFYNFELLSSVVVYNTEWSVGGTYDLSSSSNTIRGVEPNGLNKKDYYTFPAATTGQINVARYQPNSLYFAVPNSAKSQTSYFSYTNGAVASSNISASSFGQSYPSYYLSPSGEQTLWSQTAQTYEGDQNGQNQKLVSLPTGYTAYGWYDNVYILLSKNGQLYIAAASGSKQPVLIGSYFTST